MPTVLDEPIDAIRFDFGEIASHERSPEGFLTVKGVATRTGVFKYLNPDGTARYELRHPDDILDPASLKTLAGKPVTIEHPPKLIGPGNGAEQYGVGSVGNRVKAYDNGLVEVVLNAHHKDAIDVVTSGKKLQLSPGYRTKVIREDGVWEGQAYTHRQTKVEYNHLAIVEKARAGAIASLHMDSDGEIAVDFAVMDGVCECDRPSVHSLDSVGDKPRMATLQIGKASYEAPETLVAALQPQLERLDSQEAELGQTRSRIKELEVEVARLDSEKNEIATERDRALGSSNYWETKAQELEYDLEEAQKARADSTDEDEGEEAEPGPTEEEIEARIAEAAQKRVDAIDDARTLLADLKEKGVDVPDEIKLDSSMAPADIKRAVVVGLNPGEEISDEDVPGFYRALKAGQGVRADSVSNHRADMLDMAVKGAKSYGKKERKEDGDMAKHKAKMDGYKQPLTMSRSSMMK